MLCCSPRYFRTPNSTLLKYCAALAFGDAQSFKYRHATAGFSAFARQSTPVTSVMAFRSTNNKRRWIANDIDSMLPPLSRENFPGEEEWPTLFKSSEELEAERLQATRLEDKPEKPKTKKIKEKKKPRAPKDRKRIEYFDHLASLKERTGDRVRPEWQSYHELLCVRHLFWYSVTLPWIYFGILIGCPTFRNNFTRKLVNNRLLGYGWWAPQLSTPTYRWSNEEKVRHHLLVW